MKRKLFTVMLCCLMLFSVLGTTAVSAESTGTVEEIFGGIVISEQGDNDIQGWINGNLSQNPAGGSEWYVLALAQHGSYDFSSYEKSLLSYLSSNNVSSASSRLKFALCLSAIGSTDTYIAETMNEAIGQQGIMSLVFGLHLLNNGYTSDDYTQDSLIDKILSMQLSDGGWSIMGGYGDVDTTAMTIQSLAHAYGINSSVTNAVDRGLSFLSAKQKEDGDYASYGITNPESTAQVLVALSSLNIDCMNDSRFIKNGNTLLDGIWKYRLSDGSFCHRQGGSKNALATMQVFHSIVSYQRMARGQTSLYMLDNANLVSVTPPIIPTQPPTNEPIVTAPPSSQTPTQAGSEATTETITIGSSTTAQTTTSTTATTIVETTTSYNNTSIANDSATVTNSTEVSHEDTALTTDETQCLEKHDAKPAEQSFSVKLILTFVIISIGGTICVVLLLKKKGTRKIYAIVLAVTVVATALVRLISFGNSNDKSIGQVTITIRCDTLIDKDDSEFIPSDGIILDVTSYDIAAGDTVYDVLAEAAKEHKIHFEKEGNAETTYISGIHNLYEFDYGDLSGWVYHVNGEATSIGCGAYELSPDDAIEWHYSCDLERDIS